MWRNRKENDEKNINTDGRIEQRTVQRILIFLVSYGQKKKPWVHLDEKKSYNRPRKSNCSTAIPLPSPVDRIEVIFIHLFTSFFSRNKYETQSNIFSSQILTFDWEMTSKLNITDYKRYREHSTVALRLSLYVIGNFMEIYWHQTAREHEAHEDAQADSVRLKAALDSERVEFHDWKLRWDFKFFNNFYPFLIDENISKFDKMTRFPWLERCNLWDMWIAQSTAYIQTFSKGN